MATFNLADTVTDPSGTALAGVVVKARLVPATCYRADDSTVIASVVSTVTDASGNFTLALEDQDNISPTGSYYIVTLEIPNKNGGPRSTQVEMRANGTIAESETAPAPSLTTGYLTQTAGDARYLQSNYASATPATLTPDNAGTAGAAATVSRGDHNHPIAAATAGESRPGDAAAEGVSTSFSRADHTHDREQRYVASNAAMHALTGTDKFNGALIYEGGTDCLFVQDSNLTDTESIGGNWLQLVRPLSTSTTPSATYVRTAAQTVGATTEAAVAWDTRTQDNYPIGTPTFTTFTIPNLMRGLVLVEVTTAWASDPGAGSYIQLKNVTSSVIYRQLFVAHFGAPGLKLGHTWAVHVVPGDTWEIDVYNASGGGIDIAGTTMKITSPAILI